MKLSSVDIKNFRSVQNLFVGGIDNFNVLIGKNNSGKSNILSAIHAFFQILSNDSLVSSNPVIGNMSDFTQRDTTTHICISTTFTLTSDETIKILKLMRDERPEIGTALEALPQELSLSVTMSILPPPSAFSFIEQISLVSLSGEPRNWPLLQIGRASAEELHSNYRDYQATQRELENFGRALDRFDSDDWSRARRTGVEGYPFRALLDLSPSTATPDTVASVRQMISTSESFAEFQTALRGKIGKLEDSRREIVQRHLKHDVRTFSGREDQIPTYIRELIRAIVGIKILYLREQRRQIGGEEAQKILNLKTRRGGTETLTRIQKIVAQLLGVHVDAFSGEARSRPGERYTTAELDVDDFLVELNGSGIREALRLILLLDATFEEPHILLVEEPEIHLHPGLETAMMHFLKELSTKCQVFITTHSTNFIDSGDYQRIYLVTKTGTTSLEPLAIRELEERIPIEMGIRLSSLFMYDRLLFVEGPSDELIIRELCNALAINLSRSNVGFIVLRGVGNLSYYAAKETLAFLQKRNVHMTFLIDRDEKAEEEIKWIKEQLGQNVVVFPTQPRELENYLLIPEAISEYISERRSSSDIKITAEDIDSLIDAKADALKGATVLKHLCHKIRPIYPERGDADRLFDVSQCGDRFREIVSMMGSSLEELHKGVDALRQKVGAELDTKWDAAKRKLVPGTELLDEIFKTYRLRFVKLRDGPGLAAKLKVRDVDSELSGILRNLET